MLQGGATPDLRAGRDAGLARGQTARGFARWGSGRPEEGQALHRLVSIVRRLLTILVVLIVIVIAVSGSLLTILTLRGFPTTHGSLAIAGLERPVRVTRDATGIAWIEAENSHDLFLAQGYVHAQDR